MIALGDLNKTDQHRVYGQMTRSLRDAYRERGLGFTANGFRAAGISLWRVDYIFYSPALTAVHAAVGTNGGPDRRPVIARLVLHTTG